MSKDLAPPKPGVTLLLATILGLTLAGCKARRDVSDTASPSAIENGYAFPAEVSARDYGVYPVGDCSGVAVSSNTLLTAAHCESSQRSRVCIDRGRCTSRVFPAQAPFASDDGADVSAAIFPDGTFPVYARIVGANSETIGVGRPFVMVGYGDGRDRSVNSAGKWGRNIIEEIHPTTFRIKSYFGESPDRVMTWGGDSGGPLLAECLLGGISKGYGFEFDPYRDLSNHGNLLRPSLRQWLVSLRAEGAEICGLEGGTPTAGRCPPGGALRPRIPAPAANVFPCMSAPSATSSP